MKIFYLQALTDNYIWLLIDEAKQSALCVDPGEAKQVIDYLGTHHLTLDKILLTHHHQDHTYGVQALISHFPTVKIFGPSDARIISSNAVISEKKEFSFFNAHFKVLETPGHTSTAISFYESNFGLLFCGDTLFSAGCGRVFDGSPKLLHDSLLMLKSLPPETKVYCGHEYTRQNLRFAGKVEPDNITIKNLFQTLINEPGICSLPSTIGLELQINPFFRLSEPQVVNYTKQRGCKLTDTLSIFKQLREDKNNFY